MFRSFTRFTHDSRMMRHHQGLNSIRTHWLVHQVARSCQNPDTEPFGMWCPWIARESPQCTSILWLPHISHQAPSYLPQHLTRLIGSHIPWKCDSSRISPGPVGVPVLCLNLIHKIGVSDSLLWMKYAGGDFASSSAARVHLRQQFS
jgi:hypothetical protein